MSSSATHSEDQEDAADVARQASANLPQGGGHVDQPPQQRGYRAQPEAQYVTAPPARGGQYARSEPPGRGQFAHSFTSMHSYPQSNPYLMQRNGAAAARGGQFGHPVHNAGSGFNLGNGLMGGGWQQQQQHMQQQHMIQQEQSMRQQELMRQQQMQMQRDLQMQMDCMQARRQAEQEGQVP